MRELVKEFIIMDYTFSYYRGRFVYDANDYLDAFKSDYFNVIYDPKNRKKMLEEMERLVNFNSSVEIYAFAHLLYDADEKYSYDRAYCMLDMLVSWDYAPAKYLPGQMYYAGLHVEKDLKKFFALSKEAADVNFIPAKNSLAYAYFNGHGCAVDYAKGRALIQECIDADFGTAYHNAAIGYMQGSFGYPKDEKKALSYFQKASYQYYKPASYNLGLLYLNGQGCVKNVDKGLQELARAASLGHVKAQKKLGDAYYFGEITKKDLEAAYSYYLAAAENGDAYSMYSVGYMIVCKEKLGVDKYTGIDWLQKAARLGNEPAKTALKKIYN